MGETPHFSSRIRSPISRYRTLGKCSKVLQSLRGFWWFFFPSILDMAFLLKIKNWCCLLSLLYLDIKNSMWFMFSYSYMSTYFPIFHDFLYPLQRPSYPRYHDYNCSALLCAFCLIFYELLYPYCFLSIYLITFYYLFLCPKSHFRKVDSTNSDLCKKCRTTHKSVDDVSWVWTCFTSFPTRVTRSHYFGNIIGQKI